jgi:hypothetical protein
MPDEFTALSVASKQSSDPDFLQAIHEIPAAEH